MVLGILQFELFIHDSESLKDKRRVVKSVKDRLHREHMVSVAEVAALDKLNVAVMALACVGRDGARVGDVLDSITNKLRALHDAELGDVSRQLIHGSQFHEQTEEEAAAQAQRQQELGRELLDYFETGEQDEHTT